MESIGGSIKRREVVKGEVWGRIVVERFGSK